MWPGAWIPGAWGDYPPSQTKSPNNLRRIQLINKCCSGADAPSNVSHIQPKSHHKFADRLLKWGPRTLLLAYIYFIYLFTPKCISQVDTIYNSKNNYFNSSFAMVREQKVASNTVLLFISSICCSLMLQHQIKWLEWFAH